MLMMTAKRKRRRMRKRRNQAKSLTWVRLRVRVRVKVRVRVRVRLRLRLRLGVRGHDLALLVDLAGEEVSQRRLEPVHVLPVVRLHLRVREEAEISHSCFSEGDQRRV